MDQERLKPHPEQPKPPQEQLKKQHKEIQHRQRQELPRNHHQTMEFADKKDSLAMKKIATNSIDALTMEKVD